MSVQSDLKKIANVQKATILSRFFKTGKGQYGEGDVFWGIMVPQQREIAKQHKDASLEEITRLLESQVHECRLTGLFILLLKNKKASPGDKKIFYDYYLANISRINNWDLVDLSAPQIIGGWLLEKPDERKILYRLSKSNNLWERRISILSCFMFIKNGVFDDALKIAEVLLHDPHDLIHKAVGWMLREIGKIDQSVEEEFLQKHYKTMPRTMLRYSIERFSKVKKTYFMKK